MDDRKIIAPGANRESRIVALSAQIQYRAKVLCGAVNGLICVGKVLDLQSGLFLHQPAQQVHQSSGAAGRSVANLINRLRPPLSILLIALQQNDAQ